MSDRTPATEIVCELFKLLRGQWLDRAAIQRETGLSEGAVYRWVAEFTANGMLIDRDAERRDGQIGHTPREYTLAPEWGGQGA